MDPKYKLSIAAGIALCGLLCIGWWLYRPVKIIIDGKPGSIKTAAITTEWILTAGGIGINPGDIVSPAPGSLMLAGNQIEIRRAQNVSILIGSQVKNLITADTIVGNILLKLDVHLFPGDQLRLNGSQISVEDSLPADSPALLQVVPAYPVELLDGKDHKTFYSSASTVGAALWKAGFRLDPADRIEPSISTRLAGPLEVHLTRARGLVIQSGSSETHVRSAASTVGEALAEAGLSIQGQDYTRPGESEPVPQDGRIQLVRVQELVQLQQTQLKFKSTYQGDPNTELDLTSVITPGIPGIQVTRVRVRLENGKEVSRQQEGQWIARQPKDQVLGYGTKVVIHSEVVNGLKIEYWRKITAYATAYSACDAGACGRATASGAPVQRGVIAVIPSWYYAMKSQQVFIPGYGQAAIADIGGGIAGTNWVDLGFSESDYTSWHSNVTVYFLTPVPANILWVLP